MVGVVEAGVGPAVGQGAVEPLDFAVGLWPVGPGLLWGDAEIGAGVLDVVVSDDGVGLSNGESTGLGLGVPLMGDLADDVEVAAGAGTRVTARFELFGAAGPHGRRVPRQPIDRARRRVARLLRVSR